MPPISVPHVSRTIFTPAASQSDNLRWKPPVSSFNGNRRCRSWSSSIVEVVLVTSSPNKKGPSPPILVQLHIRRPPTLLAAPPTLCPVPDPACRAVYVAVLHYAVAVAVAVLHYGGCRRRLTAHVLTTANTFSGSGTYKLF